MGWLDEGLALFAILVSLVYIWKHDPIWKLIPLGILLVSTLVYTYYRSKREKVVNLGPGQF